VGLEIDPDPALEREAEETAQRVMEDRNKTVLATRRCSTP